ncbi:MAG: GNAT family N-acetyltransferase [Chloroflexi bacterium]|nr:GNAT family N-acetyltransferase [Chloroflexota bacterium]
MAVSQNLNFRAVDVQGVVMLSEEDEPEISSILIESFDRPVLQPLMSHPRPFFGIRSGGHLVSVAGTTFLSRRHCIAAVGPVATRPDHRGRGLATRACARLCVEPASLGAVVMGLHVRAANAPAIRCYEKLGFARTWGFESCVVRKEEPADGDQETRIKTPESNESGHTLAP